MVVSEKIPKKGTIQKWMDSIDVNFLDIYEAVGRRIVYRDESREVFAFAACLEDDINRLLLIFADDVVGVVAKITKREIKCEIEVPNEHLLTKNEEISDIVRQILQLNAGVSSLPMSSKLKLSSEDNRENFVEEIKKYVFMMDGKYSKINLFSVFTIFVGIMFAGFSNMVIGCIIVVAIVLYERGYRTYKWATFHQLKVRIEQNQNH